MIILIFDAHAQSYPDPLTGSVTNLRNFGCDYGPRNISDQSGSYFHPGLDYPMALDGIANTVINGTISFNYDPPSGYLARLEIGGWRYLHMLLGHTTYYQWEIDQTRNLLFIRDALGHCTLHIYSNTGAGTIIKDTWTQDQLPIETTIGSGQPIYSPALNHLHLDPGNDSWQNPLQFVSHLNSGAPTIDYLKLKFNNNGTAVEFANNTIFGTEVIIENRIITSTDGDLDKVENFIRYTGNSNFSKMVYWHYTGTDHINGGTLLNYRKTGISSIPQYNLYNQWHGTFTSLQQMQNSTLQGVYSEPLLNSSDIFKYSLNTRQKKDDVTQNAVISANAQYPDGNYVFRVTATDIMNNMCLLDQNKIIDNFRPYIEKINVSNPNLLYNAGWTPSGTNLQYSETNNTKTLNIHCDINVNVWASEAMSSMILTIGGQTYSDNHTGGAAPKIRWDFVIPKDVLSEGSNIDMSFSGEDIANNKLMHLPDIGLTQNPLPSIPLANMPVRISSTSFSSDPGNGETFSFTACSGTSLKSAGEKTSSSGSCTPPGGPVFTPQAGFNYSISGTNNNVVAFINTSLNADSYMWDFGDGDLSYENNVTHTYDDETGPKIYQAKLTAYNTDGLSNTIIKNVFINTNNSQTGGIELSGSSVETDLMESRLVNFYYTIFNENFNNTYTLSMDYGDGMINTINSNITSLSHSYSKDYIEHYYNPALTVSEWNGTTHVADYQLSFDPIHIPSKNAGQVPVSFEVQSAYEKNAILINEPFTLIATVPVNKTTQTFTWSEFMVPNVIDGSGTPIWIATNTTNTGQDQISTSFPAEGNYLIRLQYFDIAGNFANADYIASVASSAGCGWAAIIDNACSPQDKYPISKDLSFAVDYGRLDNCYGCGAQAAMIIWYLDGDEVSPYGRTCDVTSPVQTGVCLHLPTIGAHTLKVVLYPISAEGEPKIVFKPTSTERIIYGVDPDYVLSDINSNSILQANLSPNAGYITFCKTTGSSVTINSGVNVKAIANNSIHLYSGFKAVTGNTFKAKLEPSPGINCIGCDPKETRIGTCNDVGFITPVPESVSLDAGKGGDNLCSGIIYFYFRVYPVLPEPFYYTGDILELWNSATYHSWDNPREKIDIEYDYTGWCTQRTVWAQVIVQGVPSNTLSLQVGGQFGDYKLPYIPDTISTSINNLSSSPDPKIYPNPVKELLSIDLHDYIDYIISIEIFNSIGQRIIVKNSGFEAITQFDATNWIEGIYTVKISTNNTEIVQKIVKL